MGILQKLAAIQSELKAPKSQYNSFGKYHYRKCEDILEAVKPLLNKYKCLLALSDELVQIGDRYYVKATAYIEDTENTTGSGGHFSTVAYAREEDKKAGMDGSQITGASSSYARKYALNGLFAIDDTADSDTTNTGAENGQNRTQSKKAGKSSAQAQKPEETQGKRLSDEGYWNTVAAYAEGKVTDKGQDIRDWFIEYTRPTPEQLEKFDQDVDNYRAARL